MNTKTAKLVKATRCKLGLSQKEFAEKLDRQHPAICRWERGVREPSSELFIKVLELGGVKFRMLIDIIGK